MLVFPSAFSASASLQLSLADLPLFNRYQISAFACVPHSTGRSQAAGQDVSGIGGAGLLVRSKIFFQLFFCPSSSGQLVHKWDVFPAPSLPEQISHTAPASIFSLYTCPLSGEVQGV